MIDPDGQLVGDIIDTDIPNSRTDDVIYFNLKDPPRAIPLNLFDSPNCGAAERTGSTVVSA